MKNNPYTDIEEKKVDLIVFVQDYLQIQFEGIRLNFFTWPNLLIENEKVVFQDIAYRDTLCALIGKKVQKTNFKNLEYFEIVFEGNLSIFLDLTDPKSEMPEGSALKIKSHDKKYSENIVSFEKIQDQQLSAINFFEYHLELDFNQDFIECSSWPMVKIENQEYQFGHPEYRNKLCSIIPHKLKETVYKKGQSLELLFYAGERVFLDLKKHEKGAPEKSTMNYYKRESFIL